MYSSSLPVNWGGGSQQPWNISWLQRTTFPLFIIDYLCIWLTDKCDVSFINKHLVSFTIFSLSLSLSSSPFLPILLYVSLTDLELICTLLGTWSWWSKPFFRFLAEYKVHRRNHKHLQSICYLTEEISSFRSWNPSLTEVFNKSIYYFQKNWVGIGKILLQPWILLGTWCPDAASFSMSALSLSFLSFRSLHIYLSPSLIPSSFFFTSCTPNLPTLGTFIKYSCFVMYI